jgi:hypothetical protein
MQYTCVRAQTERPNNPMKAKIPTTSLHQPLRKPPFYQCPLLSIVDSVFKLDWHHSISLQPLISTMLWQHNNFELEVFWALLLLVVLLTRV